MKDYYENTVIPSIVLACLTCLGWWWAFGLPITITDIPLSFGIYIVPMTVIDYGKKVVAWIRTLN
jgi:hypothetical protein